MRSTFQFTNSGPLGGGTGRQRSTAVLGCCPHPGGLGSPPAPAPPARPAQTPHGSLRGAARAPSELPPRQAWPSSGRFFNHPELTSKERKEGVWCRQRRGELGGGGAFARVPRPGCMSGGASPHRATGALRARARGSDTWCQIWGKTVYTQGSAVFETRLNLERYKGVCFSDALN